MTSFQPHKQVPAKVTAYVDEDIKELVEVLNTFDGISTYESCEGRNKRGRLAFVYADYEGDGLHDSNHLIRMATFVDSLARSFASHNEGQDVPSYS